MLDREVVRQDGELTSASIGWDIATWSRALPWWLRHSSLASGARALEIGAGGENAGLSLWLASRGLDVTCSGLTEPSEDLRETHRRWGVQDRVTYVAVDVLAMDMVQEYDLVVFKSVLGRVGSPDRFDRQREAVQRMHRALRPGGELWFAENAVGTRLHQMARNRVGAGRWAWRYPTISELHELVTPFAESHLTSFGVAAALGRTEGQRRALARLDGALLDRLVPDSWHYVAAVTARRL